MMTIPFGPRPAAPFVHFGAFESTKLSDTGQDILGTTRHIERWRHDLEMLLDAGVRDLRYSVPWHRIEKARGRYDWRWIDGPMRFMESHGMRPVLDPLHHISFPDWLEQGFANPEFPRVYSEFVSAFAERYPWADRYTVFNEPLPTTLFCSLVGFWYPYQKCDADFVRMGINVGRAMCMTAEALKQRIPAVQFFHIDTCESHQALDRASEKWAEFANHRRWLMHDLVLGQAGRDHPLWEYIQANGFTAEDAEWFAEHAMRFDVLGLDYYMHCEMEWYWDRELGRANLSWPRLNPVGFAALAREYAERFRVPVMLGETNLRGTFRERLLWLKLMEEQCERLAGSTDFRGFCWYPSIDSTDWCNLCTKATGSVDPQGIWGLDETCWHREASQLSESYSLLARGRITSADLPAYAPSATLARDLGGFLKLVQHWEWEEQELAA